MASALTRQQRSSACRARVPTAGRRGPVAHALLSRSPAALPLIDGEDLRALLEVWGTGIADRVT